ncbi:MAG: AsnC family protein [Hydrogenophilales bacterium CG03_land_8_20_14_0_80_62_28]|nr:Lrp/AsnC family transcriptional regulator [Betaproteobacteria bacterium]OIO76918.1 MAG: AsnC family protein [Hydrogenophilaceae bacterium CG1_02_62_390]PIV23350.1 MAG: AsnC family protein [Hydrogenophilales bacterium CG03_land_8_20_14_0_80_62_28]PIW39702.1 MAG: AsnC family protein [Hydrogenophilales bacterium CG15_BIG_FIL_POST_REV_8_21_14_020_62_31]PIW72032.1 MAG: AsnC family protein [Hydrogenophilales bacterium CG12_big_fil_rev_8_21_14_0_65_61_21]PIX02147.1 MAG: AsnC family protein [Hydrog
MMPLDAVDRRIINAMQGGFPLCARPFREAAANLGISEGRLITRLKRLLHDRTLTRFGPLFNADRMGGTNVLAAMSVPEADWNDVVNLVDAQPEVAHNYRREHVLNMWFVAGAETAEQVEAAFLRIESASGLEVLRFPKEREYFVELKLEV